MTEDFALDTGHTSWLLTSSALVLFMTPGLAFFYGGMVRGRNVLAMLMQNFAAVGVVTVTWILIGYSLAFSGDVGGLGVIGNLGFFALGELGVGTEFDLSSEVHGHTFPDTVHLAFQMMLAIITPALISGAVAERMKFSAWVVFVTAWSILVYPPMAHWVWGEGFIQTRIGAIDFAGGLVVHVGAGAGALAMVLVLGPRLGWRREIIRPHALPFTLLGAGILWFGWFGFNAGPALYTNSSIGNAFLATQVASAGASLTWMLAEWVQNGRATTLGTASGAVVGQVAITPAAGFVSPLFALAIGVLAGLVTLASLRLKFTFNIDDSLDVVTVHGIGGIAGALLVGVFAEDVISGGTNGLLFGDALQLGRQAVSIVIVAVFSFVSTYLIALAIDRTIGLRVDENEERRGLDIALHEEQGYLLTE